jgi:hypothetical protein
MLRLVSAVGLAILCAGCATNEAPGPIGHTSYAPPAFQDCKITFTRFTWPGESGPGTPPSSWGPSNAVGSSVYLELFNCAHVSWGPFERGPIRFIFEMHDKGKLPETCAVSGAALIVNIERILVSDKDLSAYLHDSYGLPVEFSVIQTQTIVDTSGAHMAWSWNAKANTTSTLQSGSFPELEGPANTKERWIGMNGTGLTVLDVQGSYTNSLQNGIVRGQLAAPMLYASVVPSGLYAGVGDAATDYQASISITTYSDQQCIATT